MLKGGGSENCSAQYKLPDTRLNAGRDLEGAAKCVRDAVLQAQGKGCAPGVIGVCIGGDRGTSYEYSKAALLRKLGDENPEPALAQLENRLMKELNSSGHRANGTGRQDHCSRCENRSREQTPCVLFRFGLLHVLGLQAANNDNKERCRLEYE